MQVVHLKVTLLFIIARGRGVSCLSPCALVGRKDDGGEQDFHTGVADVVNFESKEGGRRTRRLVPRQSVTALRLLDRRK